MRHVHDRAHRDPASRTVLHRCKSPWTHRARLGGSEHTGEVPGHHRDSMLQMRICTTPAGLPNTSSSREPSASCHHGSIMQRCMAWQASTLLALALTIMLQPMPDSTFAIKLGIFSCRTDATFHRQRAGRTFEQASLLGRMTRSLRLKTVKVCTARKHNTTTTTTTNAACQRSNKQCHWSNI